jgi:hypothetical protein
MIGYNNSSQVGTQGIRQMVTSNIISGTGATNEIDRITKGFLYYNYFNGLHWKDSNFTMTRFNYIRKFIEKTIQFLVGKDGFSLTVTAYGSSSPDKVVAAAAERFLLKQWNFNKRKVLTVEMLQMGKVTGDLWGFVGWDTVKNRAIIRVLDSRYCFPTLDATNTGLLSFIVRTPRASTDGKNVVFVEEYTATTIRRYFLNSTEKGAVASTPVEELDNPLGIIPIIHVKNSPSADGYYGYSDVEDILGLNKMYNELAQELKSIIDYYGAPTTIVTGATIGNVTKKLGNVWSGLPPEANVFNLGLDVDLSAAQAFMTLLKSSMHEMADIPEGYLGKTQQISNTSGVALQLQFQPLIQQADIMWLMYGQGISDINELIVKYARLYDAKNPDVVAMDSSGKFEDEFKAEPVFPYGFPNDKMSDVQLADYEIRLKLNSRSRIMERMGVNNVQELSKEIEDEALADATFSAKVAAQVAAINAKIAAENAPPPEVAPLVPPPLDINVPSITPADLENTPQIDVNNPPKQGQ